jgi:hypothetical protein
MLMLSAPDLFGVTSDVSLDRAYKEPVLGTSELGTPDLSGVPSDVPPNGHVESMSLYLDSLAHRTCLVCHQMLGKLNDRKRKIQLSPNMACLV